MLSSDNIQRNTLTRKYTITLTQALVFLMFGFISDFMPLLQLFKIAGVESLYTAIHLLVLAISLFLYGVFLIKTRMKDSFLFITFLVFFLYWILITKYVNGNTVSLLIKAVSIIGELGFVCYFSNRDRDGFISAISFYSLIMLFLNLIYLLFFVNLSVYRNETLSLLGARNQIAIDIAFGAAATKLYSLKTGQIRHHVFYIIMAAITGILCQSATTLIGVVITIVLMFCSQKEFWQKLFSPKRVIGGYILIWLLIVAFRVSGLMARIASITGREITFSGRTGIWDYSLNMIIRNPWFGTGWHGNESLGILTYTGKFSTHNEILQLIMECGLVFVIPFLLTLLFCLNHRYKESKCSFFYFSLIVILVVWLTESPGVDHIFALLAFYYMDYMETAYENVFIKDHT